MAVNQATGYNRTTNEPLDALFLNSGSVYTSTAEVNAKVNIAVRYTGSMFNVNGEIYWYKSGVQDGDLVLFRVASASYAATASGADRFEIRDTPNATVDTDKFLVSDSGSIKYRTGAEVLSDINAQPSGNYITSLTGEVTAAGPGAASATLLNSAVIGKVLTGFNVTGGSIVATDTILQAFGKAQNQINSLMGGAIYQGVWNAATNSPNIISSTGTKGYYYVVNVAGSTNIDGITDWKVGDWIIFNGTTWDKVDNTDAVSSVNGFVGTVSLTTANIPEVTNLYYTDARVLSYGNTQYVRLDGSYSNPAWITALAWSKITGTPTTLAGYGITDAYTQTQINNFFAGTTAITGYNKSNWDNVYTWYSNNPLSGYLPLSGGNVTGTTNLATTSGNVGIGTTTADIIGYGSSGVLGIRGAIATPNIQLGTLGVASATTTVLGDINYYGMNGGGTVAGRSIIRSSLDGATNSTLFDFLTMSSGTLASRLTLSSSALTSTVPISGTSLSMSGTITGASLNTNTSSNLLGIINTTNATGGYIDWRTNGVTIADLGTATQVFGSGGSEVFAINGRGARAIAFGTNNTRRFDISSTGVGTFYEGLQIVNAATINELFFTGGDYTNIFSETTAGFQLGISNPLSAGSLEFVTANSVRGVITSGGNLGLGRTNPSSIIHVHAPTPIFTFNQTTSNSEQGILFNGGDINYGSILNNQTTGAMTIKNGDSSGAGYYIRFITDGEERLRITQTGNIGIGTTGPTAPLHVVKPIGNVAFAIGESGGVQRFSIGQEASYTGNYISSSNIDLKLRSWLEGGSGGNIIFQTANDNTSNVVERMRVSRDGSVLFNISEKLGANTASGIAQFYGDLVIARTSGIYTYGRIGYQGTSYLTITNNAHPANLGLTGIVFQTGSTTGGSVFEIARMTSQGFMGVGTDAPKTLFNTFRAPTLGTYLPQITVGGLSNYESLQFGVYDYYDGFISTYGNDLRILAGRGLTTENHNIRFYTSFVGGAAENYERFRIEYNGDIIAFTLAGAGDRIAYVNAAGAFRTATIGSGLSLSGGVLSATGGAAGTVTGTGTAGYIPKWNSASDIGNSVISQSGSTVSFAQDIIVTSNINTNASLYMNTNTDKIIDMRTSTAWNYRLKAEGDNFRIYDAANENFVQLFYNATDRYVWLRRTYINGSLTMYGSASYPIIPALRGSNFGYSSAYPTLIIGTPTVGIGNTTLAFNVDPVANPSGTFSGHGSEYLWRNSGSFITPNASNNGYNTLFSWNSTGNLNFPGAATFSSSVTATAPSGSSDVFRFSSASSASGNGVLFAYSDANGVSSGIGSNFSLNSSGGFVRPNTSLSAWTISMDNRTTPAFSINYVNTSNVYSTPFTIASTGAATFSSSLTAIGAIVGGNGGSILNKIGTVNMGFSGSGYPALGYNIRYTGTGNSYQYDVNDVSWAIAMGDLSTFRIRYAATGTAGNTISYTDFLSIANTGAATFSSSVTAGGDIYLGTRSVWLSSWLNQSVQTGANVTFNQLTATNGGFNSDLSLKNVIGLGTLLNIADDTHVIRFTWKDPAKGTSMRYGYGAQYIQALIPEAVYKANDGTLAVDYTQVHTVLIDENTRRIKALEARVKELEEQINQR